MSGLEILGVVSAAAALLELARKSSRRLKHFKNDNGGDAMVHDFQNRLDVLVNTTSHVHDMLAGDEVDAKGRALSTDESHLWLSMQSVLNLCTSQLSEFEQRLDKVSIAANGRIKRAKLNYKLSRLEPHLTRLKANIDTYITALELLSSFSQMSSQQRQGRLQQSMHNDIKYIRDTHEDKLDCIIEELGRINSQIRKQQMYSDKLSRTEIPFHRADHDIDRLSVHLEKVLDAANEVRSSLSATETISVRSQSLHNAENRWSTISPLPDNCSPMMYKPLEKLALTLTHEEPLKELAHRFKLQAKSDLDNGYYQCAETNQLESIRCFEELHTVYGIRFAAYHEMRMTLKDIYRKQQQFTRAQQILEAAHLRSSEYNKPIGDGIPPVHFDEDSIRKAHLYYDTAELNLERFQGSPGCGMPFLIEAENDAKRAFRLRRDMLGKEHPDFRSTVYLLVNIYSGFDNRKMYADTYKQLYLSDTDSRHSSISLPEGKTSRSGSIASIEGISLVEAIENHAYSVEEIGTSINLANPAQLNEIARDGRSPMMVAIDCGCPRCGLIMDKLLWKGAERNAPLSFAIRHSHSEKCQRLLASDANVNHLDSAGWTPLMHAIKRESLDLVRLLFEKGADVNKRGSAGRTALHVAIRTTPSSVTKHAEVFELLMQQDGVEVDVQDDSGLTALHECARTGNMSFARALMDAGAALEIYDSCDRKRTPLWIAVKEGKYDLVQDLLRRNVKVDLEYLPLQGRCVSRDVVNLLKDYVNRRRKSDPEISTAVATLQKRRNRWGSSFSGSTLAV